MPRARRLIVAWRAEARGDIDNIFEYVLLKSQSVDVAEGFVENDRVRIANVFYSGQDIEALYPDGPDNPS